jgi:hypothetical protein
MWLWVLCQALWHPESRRLHFRGPCVDAAIPDVYKNAHHTDTGGFMSTVSARFVASVIILALVVAIPYACPAQDRPLDAKRAIASTHVDSKRISQDLTTQLEMVDLDLKMLEQNRQRQELGKKQREQSQTQQAQLTELDKKLAELRDQRDALQYALSVQQLKHQMQMLDLDHKIQEQNRKRQDLQQEHQSEQAKSQLLMRDLDEKITDQSYQRQAMQLEQRRQQLLKQLEDLKKGQKE